MLLLLCGEHLNSLEAKMIGAKPASDHLELLAKCLPITTIIN